MEAGEIEGGREQEREKSKIMKTRYAFLNLKV